MKESGLSVLTAVSRLLLFGRCALFHSVFIVEFYNLKAETVDSPEALVLTYQTVPHHFAEDGNLIT
jgi:hypothetical protein